MPEDAVVSIAPIPLARSRARILLAPVLFLLTAAIVVAGGILLSGWQGLALIGLGTLLGALAVYLVLVPLTVRVDVEVTTLRIRWLGVDRRLALSPGAVTRVPLTGERAAKIRPRLGAFGWGLGRARLRGAETIEIVKLAPAPAVILVPTDSGRVAIAPRSEQQLVEALTAAARVQQRLEQLVTRARSAAPPRPPVEAPARPPRSVSDEAPARVLTGIERTLLEERLAAERAAALAAAEEERRAAAEAARLAAEAAARAPAPVAEPMPAAPAPRPRRRVAVRRAPWMRLPRLRPSLPTVRSVPADRLASLATSAVPLVVVLVVWAAARFTGLLTLPESRQDEASIALALTGPAAALAALAMRAWFPRLVGLVTVTALCALVLVGRALIG